MPLEDCRLSPQTQHAFEELQENPPEAKVENSDENTPRLLKLVNDHVAPESVVVATVVACDEGSEKISTQRVVDVHLISIPVRVGFGLVDLTQLDPPVDDVYRRDEASTYKDPAMFATTSQWLVTQLTPLTLAVPREGKVTLVHVVEPRGVENNALEDFDLAATVKHVEVEHEKEEAPGR